MCILALWADHEDGERGPTAQFTARGQSVSLVSLHTLKPLDVEGVAEALARPQARDCGRGNRTLWRIARATG